MKVAINSRSWHYRWYMFLNEGIKGEPTNLCGYFWFIFLSILFSAVMVFGALSFVILIMVKLFTLDWGWFKAGLMGLGVLIFMVGTLSLLGLGLEKLVKYVKGRLPVREKREGTFLQLTKAYVKAQKAKICPMVEVIHD
jgi:hypothetical protein